MPGKNYQIRLKGVVGDWNFSANQVEEALKKCKGEEVNVLITSLGGYTFDAMTISALFSQHGNVSVHYIGANASAATIAAMGAKHISMDSNALFLVHKCSNLVLEWDYFNADELEQKIEQLKKQKCNMQVIDCTVAGMYARRCKKSQAELLKLMGEERWLTAAEAKEWGFIDEVTDIEGDSKIAINSSVSEVFSLMGLPTPDSAAANAPKNEDDEKKSILQLLTGFFAGFSKQQLPKFDNLSALIGEPLKPNGSNVSLSLDQLSAVDGKIAELKADSEAAKSEAGEKEAELTALKQSLDAKQKEIDELTAQVEALSKTPAATVSSVTECGSDDKELTPGDVNSNIEQILSQLL